MTEWYAIDYGELEALLAVVEAARRYENSRAKVPNLSRDSRLENDLLEALDALYADPDSQQAEES